MGKDTTEAARIFLSHHRFVKGVALRYAPWPDLMDDIVQQVFLEFMAKESKWDLSADARPLLATMTRHVANGVLIARLPLDDVSALKIGIAELGNWNQMDADGISRIRHLSGAMDEFALWDRVLSDAEIKALAK
jgi:Sigma-70 region 2